MQQPPASIEQTFALPIDVSTCYSRGEALANMGRYLEALVHFDRVLALQPDYCKAWTFRAVILIHLGRHQEALESCDRALAGNSNDAEAWAFRGVALQRMNHYREAYASYDRALGIQRRVLRRPWVALWHRLLRFTNHQATS